MTAPNGDKTRPTSDKIRGSLFNILMSRIPESRVLDLFGGTGAMALEAMSRGAAHATIVDADRQAIEAIRKNTLAVMGEDHPSNVDIVKSDYKRALASMGAKRFDIVILDPPYAMVEAYAVAQNALKNGNMLSENAVIVCERARDASPTYAPGFEVYDTRTYGDTAVDLVRLRQEDSE